MKFPPIKAVSELWSILDRISRGKFLFLIATSFITGLLEIAAIISLSQFVSMLVKPGIANQGPRTKAVISALGIGDDLTFSMTFGITVVVLLILSNASASLNIWMTLRFIWGREKILTARLLERYLQIPYIDMVKLNSGDLLKNLLSGVLTNGVLRPLIVGTAYAVVAIMVVLLIVLADPAIALGMTLLVGTCYGTMSLVMSSYLKTLGEETHHYAQKRYRTSQEALGGIKAIKVLGRERAFINRYSEATNASCDRQATKAILDVVPRYFLEVVAFGGIISVVLVQLYHGAGPEAILPSLTLVTFAGYRLIPAIHNIYANWTEIQFNAAALTEVVQELIRILPADNSQVAPLLFEQALRLEKVGFGYVAEEPDVLADLTLTIAKGDSIGIVGPTGSGKTTLIDILLGLFQPDRGTIFVDDTPVTEANRRAWQANLGYVPQDIYLLDDTVERNIAFGLADHEIDKEAVRQAAQTAQIDVFIDEMPHGYQTTLGDRGVRLSGGQRQRLGIARAVYSNPQVILLDEATSALDNVTERSVVAAIRELAKTRTVITIAHRLSTVKECDQIFVLAQGRLVEQGTYDELYAREGVFREMALRAEG